MPDVRSVLSLFTDEPLAQLVLSLLAEAIAGALIVFGAMWVLLRVLEAVNRYPGRPAWLAGYRGSWLIRVARWAVGITLASIPGSTTAGMDWIVVVGLGWAWGEGSESVYRWLRLVAEQAAEAGRDRLLRLLRGAKR